MNDFENIYIEMKHDLLLFLKWKFKYITNIEDYVNDTFIAVHKYIKKYDPDKGSFKNYIYTIAANIVKQDIIKNNKLNLVSIDKIYFEDKTYKDILTEDEPDVKDIYIINKKASIIKDAIYSLEDKYKDVLILKDIEGLQHKEITKKLNIGLSSSKNRVRIGRELVKKKVKKQFKLLDEN